jgi:hypothetical protein
MHLESKTALDAESDIVISESKDSIAKKERVHLIEENLERKKVFTAKHENVGQILREKARDYN